MKPSAAQTGQVTGKPSLRRRASAALVSWWAPILVASVCVCTTVIATSHTLKLADQDRELQARSIQDTIHSEIEEVFGRYTDALHHTKGFVLSSKHIDLHEWKVFVSESRLEKIHPGVWGFGYVQRVDPHDAGTLIDEMASYGVGDFEIKPPPGRLNNPNEPMYVVKFEEPESRNRSAWGLNVAASPVNRAVYDAATDSGEHQLSKPFKLAQTSHDSRHGVVMVTPHFRPGMPTETVQQRREAVAGWLAVVIDFAYFFEHEWRPGWEDAGISLRMEGSDGELVLVHGHKEHRCAQHGNTSTTLYTIDLVGGELLLGLCVDHAALESSHDTYAIIACAVGGGTTFLVTAIAVLISRSRRYAYEIAERMTHRLRESEQEQRELADQALAASNAKSMFLANMSHEIRTPMTAIIGYSEIIEEALVSKGCDSLTTPVRRVRAAGDHLLTLINDILDLSKIESGRFDIDTAETELAGVIRQSVATLESRAQSKGLEISSRFTVPERVMIDGYRLRQILINLLGNAVKFTEYGGIKLSCEVEDQHLVFRVKDTGVGIKREQLEQIFSPFSQADESMNRRHQGTGLGLAISKALAQLMRGRLSATSTPGVGSEFVLMLPLETALGCECIVTERTPIARTPGQATGDQPVLNAMAGRVLVAEDGPDNQRLIKHHLTKAGLSPEFVDNGLEAVQRLRAGESYDLIVMDMQMPVMDGYEATRTLRAEGFTTPVLALTAHAMAHDRERCLDAGCDAYESKPIKKSSLLTTIASLMDQPSRAAA